MELYQEALKAMNELCERANLKKGQIVVVGCSTSEIMGKRIGSSGTLEVAQEVLRGLMEQSGLFFRRFNLHVIQCDARVQRDDKIVDLRAFERHIDSLELYGGGGTDFRPAFEHIDALVASGELRGLKVGIGRRARCSSRTGAGSFPPCRRNTRRRSCS